jgi:hypothetical protein
MIVNLENALPSESVESLIAPWIQRLKSNRRFTANNGYFALDVYPEFLKTFHEHFQQEYRKNLQKKSKYAIFFRFSLILELFFIAIHESILLILEADYSTLEKKEILREGSSNTYDHVLKLLQKDKTLTPGSIPKSVKLSLRDFARRNNQLAEASYFKKSIQKPSFLERSGFNTLLRQPHRFLGYFKSKSDSVLER